MIETTLQWKRTDEEKPQLGEWVWGVFMGFIGEALIKRCRKIHYKGIERWQNRDFSFSLDYPIYWTERTEGIKQLECMIAKEASIRLGCDVLSEKAVPTPSRDEELFEVFRPDGSVEFRRNYRDGKISNQGPKVSGESG